MIVDSKIKIKVQPNTRKYYNSLGYICSNYEEIEINTIDLSKGSNKKIKINCDNCTSEKLTTFNKYYKSTKSLTEKYFCKKCNHLKAKQTKLEKYGDENYNNRKKAKQTKLEKYGDENYNNRSSAVETCLEKYGVNNVSKVNSVKLKKIKSNIESFGCENPFQSEIIKSKIKKTNLDKFGSEYYITSDDARKKYIIFCEGMGVDHYSKSDEFKSKFEETCLRNWGEKTNLINSDVIKSIKKTNLIKYGFDHVMKNKDVSLLNTKSLIDNRSDFFEKLGYEYISYDFDDKLYKLKKKECGHEFDINYDLFRSRMKYSNNSCMVCFPKSENISIKEIELSNWIKSLGVVVVNNDRSVIKKEIDILLPDFKVGIEFNGLYYHCDKFKDKHYHSDKTDSCIDIGINLLHIWEDDWINRQDIVKSIIMNRLGLSPNKLWARKCDIREVSVKESRKFLDSNHIQGYTNSSIRIGLYYSGELVSLMTFGNRRINSKNTFELIRFCNKINTNIIGGASKLFKHLIKDKTINKILSYSDRSLFTGNLYEKLGFENDGKTSLNYYWTDLYKRYHRFNFNKKKLVKMGYDKNLTENQIMRSIGYYKIWSSGQIRWIWSRI